jgi:hypothetical protein
MVILVGKKLCRAVIEYVDMRSDSNGPSMFVVVNGPVDKAYEDLKIILKLDVIVSPFFI